MKNAVERMVYDTIVAGSVDQLNANAYVDGALSVTERFTVNPSVRVDVFNFIYADARGDKSTSGQAMQMRVSPKLNFDYYLSDRAQLYLRTGMGFHSNDARAVVVDSANATLPRAYGTDLGTTFKPLPRMLVNVALWALYL
ncbi:MAG: TonB-dependent receptor [Flavobacteriales bacterium]|nr:TonB-dependent receptor [Flavobacteriales bacterium]